MKNVFILIKKVTVTFNRCDIEPDGMKKGSIKINIQYSYFTKLVRRTLLGAFLPPLFLFRKFVICIVYSFIHSSISRSFFLAPEGA